MEKLRGSLCYIYAGIILYEYYQIIMFLFSFVIKFFMVYHMYKTIKHGEEAKIPQKLREKFIDYGL